MNGTYFKTLSSHELWKLEETRPELTKAIKNFKKRYKIDYKTQRFTKKEKIKY